MWVPSLEDDAFLRVKVGESGPGIPAEPVSTITTAAPAGS
jgi:hypothetical protein